MGAVGQHRGLAGGVFSHEWLAAEFCLPGGYQYNHLYRRLRINAICGICHGQLSNRERGIDQSRRCAKKRIIYTGRGRKFASATGLVSPQKCPHAHSKCCISVQTFRMQSS